MHQPQRARHAPDAAASRRFIPDNRRRDALIAILAGTAALAFLVYALVYFSRQAESTGGVEGVIVAKEFVPRPETQITVGRDGLTSRHVAGEYRFRLRVDRENGKLYTVPVSEGTYAAHREGERFYFFRTPPAM